MGAGRIRDLMRGWIRELVVEGRHPRMDGWVGLLQGRGLRVVVEVNDRPRIIAMVKDEGGKVIGLVEAMPAASAKESAGDGKTPPAPCAPGGKRAWSIVASVVGKEMRGGGLGSLLYEVVLETVSRMGGWLTSDRQSVSPEAERIWFSWLSKRGDAEWVQLDDAWNVMTGDVSDNCVVPIDDPHNKDGWGGPLYQKHSKIDRVDIKRAELENLRSEYERSPLMKAWRKPGSPVTDELNVLGLLVKNG
jgi:hypothetical protein